MLIELHRDRPSGLRFVGVYPHEPACEIDLIQASPVTFATRRPVTSMNAAMAFRCGRQLSQHRPRCRSHGEVANTRGSSPAPLTPAMCIPDDHTSLGPCFLASVRVSLLESEGRVVATTKATSTFPNENRSWLA